MTKKVQFQLYDQMGRMITATGGAVYVSAGNGDAAKATLTNKAGTGQSNPFALTNGSAEFYVANTVTAVDLFIDCPSGHFVVVSNVEPNSTPDIVVDLSTRHTVMVIPFSMDDLTAATETDTGFDTKANRIFLPNPVIRTITLDATETIDVGTDGSGANDPDGFVDGASVATAVSVVPTLTNGSATLGVLFSVQDSANSGDLVPEAHYNSTSENITITLSAGSDTAEGYVYLPCLLCT